MITDVTRISPCSQLGDHERWRTLKCESAGRWTVVQEPEDSTPVDQSLVAIRVVAAVGALVAMIAVVVGFGYGVVYGIGALLVLPALPLLFVLAFEAVRSPGGS